MPPGWRSSARCPPGAPDRRSVHSRAYRLTSACPRRPKSMPGLTPIDDDKFHDHCGLFGIYGHPEAARLTYLGLYALQHRGQESAGIVASDGQKLRMERAMGLVSDIFTDEKM